MGNPGKVASFPLVNWKNSQHEPINKVRMVFFWCTEVTEFETPLFMQLRQQFVHFAYQRKCRRGGHTDGAVEAFPTKILLPPFPETNLLQLSFIMLHSAHVTLMAYTNTFKSCLLRLPSTSLQLPSHPSEWTDGSFLSGFLFIFFWHMLHQFNTAVSSPARPKGGQRPASAVQRERERS